MSTSPFGSLHLCVHKESNDVTAGRCIEIATLSRAQSTLVLRAMLMNRQSVAYSHIMMLLFDTLIEHSNRRTALSRVHELATASLSHLLLGDEVLCLLPIRLNLSQRCQEHFQRRVGEQSHGISSLLPLLLVGQPCQWMAVRWWHEDGWLTGCRTIPQQPAGRWL